MNAVSLDQFYQRFAAATDTTPAGAAAARWITAQRIEASGGQHL